MQSPANNEVTQSSFAAQREIILTLVDRQPGESLRQWRFTDAKTIQIGRSLENDVRILNRTVSRFHASVFRDGKQWIYANIGKAGTYVDGKLVSHISIQDGSVVRLSRSGPKIRFDLSVGSKETDDFDDQHPVSLWLDELRQGDDEAAQKLWEMYSERIVNIARNRLSGSSKRVSDEEDVALSVFNSLFVGVAEGRFPELSQRDSLWRLLVVMTVRKAINHIYHERRQKRGGGGVRGESILLRAGAGGSIPPGFEQFMGDSPTPEFEAALTEELQHLLELLGNEELRSIAQWKMEGYSNEEIAEKLGCTSRTVRRQMEKIRESWMKALAEDDDSCAGTEEFGVPETE